MSHQMVSRVLEHSNATGPAFALLLILAHHEYGKGWVATQDALAAKARISRATVQRALIDLQVEEELEVTPRGKKRPKHHRVILDCPLECPDHLKHCYVPMHQSDASEGIGCIRVEHSMHQSDARSSSDSSSSLQKKRRGGTQKRPSRSAQPDPPEDASDQEDAERRATAGRLTQQFGQRDQIGRVHTCLIPLLPEVEESVRAELLAEVGSGNPF